MTFHENVARLRVLLAQGRDDRADLAPTGALAMPPLLLGSWGANVERAAREFDGWLASGYRTHARRDHRRARAVPGCRRTSARSCAPSRCRGEADLGPTGEVLHRYGEAGFDDAVVLIEPGGPDPEQVRALLP